MERRRWISETYDQLLLLVTRLEDSHRGVEDRLSEIERSSREFLQEWDEGPDQLIVVMLAARASRLQTLVGERVCLNHQVMVMSLETYSINLKSILSSLDTV